MDNPALKNWVFLSKNNGQIHAKKHQKLSLLVDICDLILDPNTIPVKNRDTCSPIPLESPESSRNSRILNVG